MKASYSFNYALRNRFKEYDKKINWIVFCFVFCFTIGAWIDYNGIFCELPIMVAELPEGWRLPSIISMSSQLAQIGPIIFIIGRKFFPKTFSYVNVNYVILGIGTISCLLLSFFWNKTGYVFGEKHSIGLISLNFILAVLDGTSSVTFVPYIGGNFIKEYLIPNYIGESLSALIPSVLSLLQGLGQDPGCYNVTDLITNTTSLVPRSIVPNYPVKFYFIFMFLLLCISTVAFTLLNYSRVAIRERKKDSDKSKILETVDLELQESDQVTIKENFKNLIEVKLSNKEKYILFVYTYFLTFVYYGFLPGLQSYSTLPYGISRIFYVSIFFKSLKIKFQKFKGNDIFNYSINLGYAFMPFAIIFTIWSYEASVLRITVEYSIANCFAVYIIFLSIMSPCPPFLDSWIGPFLSVLSWILVQTIYLRVRCLIATRLEKYGQKNLLVMGLVTQMGQLCGGVFVFIIVNIYVLFKEKPICVNDFNLYC